MKQGTALALSLTDSHEVKEHIAGRGVVTPVHELWLRHFLVPSLQHKNKQLRVDSETVTGSRSQPLAESLTLRSFFPLRNSRGPVRKLTVMSRLLLHILLIWVLMVLISVDIQQNRTHSGIYQAIPA